ncbi:hypothetical protein [uncultured Gimesia sp.]|uniref:hypothetical protein n=1 Tax=uncultured Gimesia sp. TaxID=1678688 RepID=UPI0030DA96BB
MAHSHLPIQHLMKQMENFASDQTNINCRPSWLSSFVDEVADIFNPYDEVGRVGFDCQFTEECWEVGLFLGSTEIVGGQRDGQFIAAGFQFDLLQLLDRFESVNRFHFHFMEETEPAVARTPAASYITIEGHLADLEIVRLNVYATPPEKAGPGFRKSHDGKIDTV